MRPRPAPATTKTRERDAIQAVPLIPLRDMVVFPHVTLPVVVRREKSLRALEAAMQTNRMVLFVAQTDEAAMDPAESDMERVGTIGRIREVADLEGGGKRILVEGDRRVRIKTLPYIEPFFVADTELLRDPKTKKTEHVEALMYGTLNQFRRVANMGASVPFDILLVVMNVSDPWLLGDLIAANLDLNVAEKQAVLEAATIEEKLERVSAALGRQVKVLQMASRIQAETGKELDKMQREAFLREQMRSIERELETLSGKGEGEDLRERILGAGMPAATKEKALKEHDRLKAMPSYGPETSYVRTYLEWLCDVPWEKRDEGAIDLVRAQAALDAGHFGLAKVKERVLEHLALRKLSGGKRSPILCFVGPPGTGKTSVGKAIAEAVGRAFVRVSLGGVRDEADIRGHRRTYVGALPGRIVQGIVNAKRINPVFMLDEIDKMSSDFRGDPGAALLETLDPEQNNSFTDHYLEVPLDLSETMFIATANTLDTVPPALRDRMEVIEFSSYTEPEKREIARRHLLPRLLEDTGLSGKLEISDKAVAAIIANYTREAGVRNLGREISALARKAARRIVEGGAVPVVVNTDDLEKMLGPAKFLPDQRETLPYLGVVTGLAWTEVGGEILRIETTAAPGTGVFTVTGNLGEVMKESAQAARTFARTFVAAQPRAAAKLPRKSDIHVHVPSGAVPKDGPSAGLAIAVALTSLMTGVPARADLAMTGELTLTGRVLEIGGVKEKVLAAHRYGIRTVILPEENRKDLVDVPEEVRGVTEFIFVRRAEEAIQVALVGKDPRQSKTKKNLVRAKISHGKRRQP